MGVHRLDQGDVAVGVESAGELVAVEVEVTLDGVASAVAERSDPALPGACEPLVQFAGGAVAQQGNPSGEREAAVGAVAFRGVVVRTVRKSGVHADHILLHRLQGDLVGGGCFGGGEDPHPFHPVGVTDGPLEHVHPTHGSANGGRPSLDTERIREGDLRGDLVPDGDKRKP